ncbi:heterokaryon incompatibility protein-domain-containing protein, partial [Bisporella sp. PMI_857]
REVSQMIDIGLLKRWLRECDLFHGVRCKAEPEIWNASNRQGHFRLIDVEEEKIIPAFGRNLKYLALSYVWGGFDVSQLTLLESTSKRLFNKGGLAPELSNIPTTIKDAMKITQMLGYRYLWVDALCIFQDSATDQAIQIKKMHKIYEYSELTIVCAAGADSWVGLPGVSSRTQTQHIEAIQGLRLANILPGFTQTIQESIWITRAWTLQEMYFSKRMLYFTDSQVYFKCE